MERDEDAVAKALTQEFNSFMVTKDIEGAEKFLERTLQTVKKTEGETSISLAKAYQSLGTFYFSQEKYPQAVEMARNGTALF